MAYFDVSSEFLQKKTLESCIKNSRLCKEEVIDIVRLQKNGLDIMSRGILTAEI